ncbi:MAG TPA: UDP-N-acetylmuramate dehydrogenase [Saprospiraceae bacterium]|nr:UDP-N-acetylmuramate dehydrogenase [Saprospiraceae bacterium]HMQ83613.1 UDP-N-acetylmuramate dehydrogenase [Saprospiraceae bacterium]
MKKAYDFSLRAHNTFGIEARAKEFVIVLNEVELKEVLLEEVGQPILLLGGGSNILFTQDIDIKVIKNRIGGKRILEKFGHKVRIAVGAGENWHELVLWSLQQGFGGLENLSLIPGTVGASPIQNIGAYGVELKDVFYGLKAMHVESGESRFFDKAESQFGYRDSIFKRELKGQYIITEVQLDLTLYDHKLNTSYGAIEDWLREHELEAGIQEISQAVIAIRRSKLPDPQQLGNAGSFFKNPEVSKRQSEDLLATFPKMPWYPAQDATVKIPAGWLIEQCGWKGKRIGDAGCYDKQALVLVNYGSASGKEILDLAQQITASVQEKFDILLSPEVNII